MYNQQYQNTGISQYQGLQKQFQPLGNVQSFYGQSQQSQQQYGNYPSSESFHTANHRGNQLGHDAGLRGDSFTPAQHQGFGAQSGFQGNPQDYSSARYGIRGNEQGYNGQNNVSQQYGFNNAYGGARGNVSASFGQTSSYGQGFAPSAESFHTANYRGNQLGHDAGLRGDSFSPAQHQGFGGAQSGFQNNAQDYNSFRYGVRGNEQGFGGQNNVSQQFGFNNAF